MIKYFKLIRKRSFSIENYRQFQSFIAEKTVRKLEKMGCDLVNSFVLELGSGYGGYSIVLNKKARVFIAADINKDNWFSEVHIPFVQLDVLDNLPFANNTIDFIYCSSLIEHIADPNVLLENIWSVLKSGGILYISFPPFYSLSMVGGHQFKPFHLLGEKFAVRITNWIKKSNYSGFSSAYGSFGLFPLTIDKVKKLLVINNFIIKETFTRMIVLNTTRLPGFLKDLATWHVCYIAKKPQYE